MIFWALQKDKLRTVFHPFIRITPLVGYLTFGHPRINCVKLEIEGLGEL